MASLDAINKQQYPIGRRHTRNRTSYGSMHNWLHSELSGHNLSGYKDPEGGRLVAKHPPGFREAPAGFVMATQRGCQTVPEEVDETGAAVETVRLASPAGIMPDYPKYRELRQCMTERDRNRYGVNYRNEDLVDSDGRTKLPILPSPRPHDQNPPVHLQYGPKSTGYDDAHKAYLKQSGPNGLAYGQPKLRNGKGGSTWRHLKFPMQPDGTRRQFLDGQVSLSDAHKRQLRLRPELMEQQLMMQEGGQAAQRFQRQVYDVNRRPTAKRGMEYNNWLVMR